MILVDTALRRREENGRPIQVALIGAGFMAQGLANQIAHSVPGMRVAAIYARRPEQALGVCDYAALGDPVVASSQSEVEDDIRANRTVLTDDAFLLCRAEQIDVLVDLTGSVEFGAQVVLEAVRNGKHIVLMNAELDATIGPILNVYTQQAGVIMSACDGDEPGLQMNLVRWVQGLGLTPRVIGNVKGLQDPYRNPETQRGFAEKWGQNPAMVTSFADGSKISFEQTIVANATGSKVLKRGMSRGIRFDGVAPGAPIAVRHRPDQGTRQHHRLHRRAVVGEGVRPGRAFRPQAEALPEPVQAGRRAALPVLDPIPPTAHRDAQRHSARRAVRR